MLLKKRIQAFNIYNNLTGDFSSLARLYSDKLVRLINKRIKNSDRKATAHKILIRLHQQYQTLYYRPLAGDTEVLHEIFVNRVYEFPFSIDEVKTIVDLGAHIGLAGLFLATKYLPETIICVEPMDDNFSLLQSNLNQLQGVNVFLENKAISNQNEVRIRETLASFNSSVSSDGQLLVEGITITELIERYKLTKIDLLKIDIEDSEKELFSSSTDWLEKVRAIVIEIHSEKSKSLFLDKVQTLGFQVVQSATAKDIFFAISSSCQK